MKCEIFWKNFFRQTNRRCFLHSITTRFFFFCTELKKLSEMEFRNCIFYCWSCDVVGVEWVWWTDDLLEKLIKTMESSHNIAANYQHNTHNTTDKCKLFPINLQQQLLIELLYLDYWKPRIQNVGLNQRERKTEKGCYFKDAWFINSYKFSW